ncbi:YkyA family protein [Macrococcus equi]|uniref:YkyA family protein n=1 Tax=Macrococcus equi TaxID=3395462 RepID=UPI0039BE8AB7
MKYIKGLFLISLIVILAACSNKTADLQAFYNQVDEGNKIEKKLEKTSADLEKLENDKLQLFNKVNKAKAKDLKGLADKLIKNTDERKKTADKESEVMKKSQKIFEESKQDAKSVKDKTQKKHVEKLVTVLDDKYAKHENLMKSYQEILKKEQDLFKYLKDDALDKSIVNEKIAAITKLYEGFQKKTDDYTKTSRLVEQRKQSIVKILNEK